MTIEHITLSEPEHVIDARVRADMRRRQRRELMLHEHMEKLRRMLSGIIEQMILEQPR